MTKMGAAEHHHEHEEQEREMHTHAHHEHGEHEHKNAADEYGEHEHKKHAHEHEAHEHKKHAHEHHHEHEHHGHEHHGHEHGHSHAHGGGEENRGLLIARLCVSAALLGISAFLLPEGWTRIAGYALAYLVIGYDILWGALRNILRGEIFDEIFLMTVASLGAFAVGEQAEGAAVMLLFQLGELFEDLAADRTRDAVSRLTDLRPDAAEVEIDGKTVACEAKDVEVGSVIVVRPGGRVPLDGVIVEGETELDTSALTGESLPRAAGAGDRALSGCVNLRGVIRVRVEKEYGDSEAARVLSLVEDASARKAKSEQFITKFARAYTPAVCALALLIAVVPPIFLGDFKEWIHRALVFLVISCPCALVISVPLTFFAGIGALSRKGVLVKGSSYLEQLSRAETFVFDKTGTLTEGKFRVREVRLAVGSGQDALSDGAISGQKDALVELAAHAEAFSDHPLARAVREAFGGGIDRSRVGAAEELAGRGVRAAVDGKTVLAGNRRLMEENGIACEEIAGSALHVAADGAYLGSILLEDAPKAGAKEALERLRALGAKRLVMLTGDAADTAKRVAEQVGVTEFHGGLLPGDKVDYVEKLLSEKKNGTNLAFVGDGINDAPALALSDVGVAMGAMGSDAAIEAADVVLMDDNPGKLPPAVKGARRTLGIVKQNIAFSLAVKAAVLVLGALGFAGMWPAVFADVGVTLLAIANASRALRVKE